MGILDTINKTAQGLRRAAVWQGTGDLIAEVETENLLDAQPSYVYEFRCLMRLVQDLKREHTIVFYRGVFPQIHYFPKSPAPKLGWPRIHIHDQKTGALLMQVCGGTKVAIAVGNKIFHAPDVSFQKPDASDAPIATDVYLIYDAKLNEGSKKKGLSKGQFSDFTQVVRDFGLNAVFPISLPVCFTELTDLQANCILTNGAPWNLDHDYHRFNFLRVIYGFFPEGGVFGVVG